MEPENKVPSQDTSGMLDKPLRPTRRAMLQLTVGTAIAGAVGVLGLGPARASTCTDACTAWNDECNQWCANHGNDAECYEACFSLAVKECENCCFAGGSADQCVPPSPPAKAALANLRNTLWVTAELGYTGNLYGMLRARASSIGPWEKFDMLNLGSELVALKASNGRYVSAELGYTGNQYAMLRARATSIGPWEKFTLGDSFQGGTGHVTYTLRASNGLFVSSELGDTGNQYAMLRARANTPGPWEDYALGSAPA